MAGQPKFLTFPGGEVHCELDPDQRSGLLVMYGGKDLNDRIFKTLLLTDVLKRRGIRPRLFIPYLPYARQDRPMGLKYPFSLKVLGDILNQQDYEAVYTLDVHSDVAYGCIDRLVNLSVSLVFNRWNAIAGDFSGHTLVVPDQGATKRLHDLSSRFKHVAIGIKTRDPDTGKIILDNVVGDARRDCLIIDDICDGGFTFILLAKALKQWGATSISLMVSHGIFSKGLHPLQAAGIDKIYTTDSYDGHGTPNRPANTLDLYKTFTGDADEPLIIDGRI